MIRKLASLFPARCQMAARRRLHAWQIRRGTFLVDEPEADKLAEWIGTGDTVLDVGANIGRYTLAMSRLVGEQGRVIAFEPVPATFQLLTHNAGLFPCRNVTLINAAASDTTGIARMTTPSSDGLPDLYLSRMADGGALRVLTLPVDSLGMTEIIRLVKIDVEGHELPALRGMEKLLRRNMPVIVIESSGKAVGDYLGSLGFEWSCIDGSPNSIFTPKRSDAPPFACERQLVADKPAD